MCAAVLALSGCATPPGERLVGTDPAGNRVEVTLLRPLPVSEELICLASSDSTDADMRIKAQPPGARKLTLHVSARQDPECASLVTSTVAYLQTKGNEPELCLYLPAALNESGSGEQAPILGVWDFCTKLRKVNL